MCQFFSFISKGDGQFLYADSKLRQDPAFTGKYNPDSHSSLATYFLGSPTADDRCNKYEYTSGELFVDQINTTDDSAQATDWITALSKTQEFYNICLAAVTRNSVSLYHVPRDLMTPEIIMAAVSQDGWALEFVPRDLMTPEIIMAAVTQSGLALCHVPRDLMSPEVIMAAVTQDGLALKFVPHAIMIPEIIMAAVTQNGWALEFVPRDLITDEIREMALNNR